MPRQDGAVRLPLRRCCRCFSAAVARLRLQPAAAAAAETAATEAAGRGGADSR